MEGKLPPRQTRSPPGVQRHQSEVTVTEGEQEEQEAIGGSTRRCEREEEAEGDA